MIRSFRSKALKRYFDVEDASKVSVVNVRRLDAILRSLNVVRQPEDMNAPGWRFHALKDKMSGRYSVTVSGNLRVTFGWEGIDAIDVDLEDYH